MAKMNKVITTFNFKKLAKKIDKRVAMGLTMLAKDLNKDIQENLDKGLDVKNKPFDPLAESTGNKRMFKQGYYKRKGGGSILNYTGNMRKTKVTPAKPGPVPIATVEMTGKNKKGQHYGAFHNKGGKNLPKRKWFGMTKNMQPGDAKHTVVMQKILTMIRRDWKK